MFLSEPNPYSYSSSFSIPHVATTHYDNFPHSIIIGLCIVINLGLYLERGTAIRNEERVSGTRNGDPKRGTAIRSKERRSGKRDETPYDFV